MWWRPAILGILWSLSDHRGYAASVAGHTAGHAASDHRGYAASVAGHASSMHVAGQIVGHTAGHTVGHAASVRVAEHASLMHVAGQTVGHAASVHVAGIGDVRVCETCTNTESWSSLAEAVSAHRGRGESPALLMMLDIDGSELIDVAEVSTGVLTPVLRHTQPAASARQAIDHSLGNQHQSPALVTTRKHQGGSTTPRQHQAGGTSLHHQTPASSKQQAPRQLKSWALLVSGHIDRFVCGLCDTD